MSDKKEYSVNVRISSSENEILTKTAETLRVSKSEIVRMVMSDKLNEFESKPRKTISKIEQQNLMKLLANLVNVQRAKRRELARIGTNLNQLAKTSNVQAKATGNSNDIARQLSMLTKQKKQETEMSAALTELKKEVDKIVVENEAIAERVQEIWQLLV